VSSPFPVSVLNNEVLRIPFCCCCFVRDSAVAYIYVAEQRLGVKMISNYA